MRSITGEHRTSISRSLMMASHFLCILAKAPEIFLNAWRHYAATQPYNEMKTRSGEMSARDYALHNVCTHPSFFSFLLLAILCVHTIDPNAPRSSHFVQSAR